MRDWLLQLDTLLRGEATSQRALGDGLLNVSARGLAVIVLVLAMIYGMCMGSFSLLKEAPPELAGGWDRFLQVIASALKVPALFFLTLFVTFPSLYVFNALVGSRLRLLNLLRLLISSLAVNVAVLSSLGLIVAFFSLSTSNYPFVVLLNVAVFSVSGALGLMFLLQTMHRMTSRIADLELTDDDSHEPELIEQLAAEALEDKHGEQDDPDSDEQQLSPTERIPAAIDMPEGQVFARHTRMVFRCWVVLFSVVGAQMGWVLRPFIGAPNAPFSWFRERDSNFFASVLSALWNLISGGT